MFSRWPSSVKASAFFIAAFIVGSPNTHLMCMARPKSSPLPPQMSVIDQMAPCEMHAASRVLVAAGARRVIAAQRGAADRDARGVDVRPREQPVDALADGDFRVEAIEDVVAAKRAALPRPVDHEHGNAALQATMGLHEPHLVLDGIEPAHADQHRHLVARERRAHEVTAKRNAVLVGNLHHLAGRVQIRDELLAAILHASRRSAGGADHRARGRIRPAGNNRRRAESSSSRCECGPCPLRPDRAPSCDRRCASTPRASFRDRPESCARRRETPR